MPVKGVRLCGAKCRTKNGAPCEGPAMQNGRCRMHGGVFYERETHGKTTKRAKEQRKKERGFLRELKDISKEIKDKE